MMKVGASSFNFNFFYKIYRECSQRILKVEKTSPDDNSPYAKIASIFEDVFLDICFTLYWEEELPIGLQKDVGFYEKAFFGAMEKEELPMLMILALVLQNGDSPNSGVCPYQKHIQKDSYHKLLHKCLEILEKNGTDMLGNGIVAFVYENILIVYYTQNIEYAYILCQKLFYLKETPSWAKQNISRMYYDTFEALAGRGAGKREFDLLLDFYQRTTLTYIKEEHVADALFAYVKAGLCDENYCWIGGDRIL